MVVRHFSWLLIVIERDWKMTGEMTIVHSSIQLVYWIELSLMTIGICIDQ
jgi:hypothetical protein